MAEDKVGHDVCELPRNVPYVLQERILALPLGDLHYS